MTREETIENLLILKKSAEETVGNRQQNIEYTILHDIKSSSFSFVVDMAIEALKQEPSGDAISRQAVLDGLASIAKAKAKSDAQKSLMGRIMFFTEHLPSVNPQEPKTGHWRAVYQGDEIIDYRCSECEFGNTFGKGTYGMNYCPNCGAKMEER